MCKFLLGSAHPVYAVCAALFFPFHDLPRVIRCGPCCWAMYRKLRLEAEGLLWSIRR